MMKTIILIPSESMDNNKKEGRNENSLLRVPKATRNSMLFNEKSVELAKQDKDTFILKPFRAFSADIENAKKLLNTSSELKNVGFVSTRTYSSLGLSGSYKEVAIIDTYLRNLIGTDPELLLTDGDNIINASSVPGLTKTTKFGSDGAMAELRPDPAYTAEQLTDNIRNILLNKELTKPADKYDWISACYHRDSNRDYPVGAHIHIDNPKKIEILPTSQKRRLFAVVNKILDELLTVPMIRLDGKDGYRRRSHCMMSAHNGFNTGTYGKGYGFFGEWRICKGHLEHRSLSGLVLIDPDICTAVLGTAQAIADAAYKFTIKNKLDPELILPKKFHDKLVYRDDFTSWDEVPLAASLNCTLPSGTLSGLMNRSNRREINKTYINKWFRKMCKLPTYSDYSTHISTLFDILSSSTRVLDKLNRNIKEIWRK